MGCRLQDLVRSAQLLDLALELAHPGPLIRRQPWPLTSIGLGPPHPLTQRLMIDRQLRRDRLDRLPLRRVLVLVLEHHPHRPRTHLRGIRTRPPLLI
jgi:hypothetical protein